jgi:hypothetical protein
MRRREFASLLLAAPLGAQSGWKTPFDGRSLSGWHSTGKAVWSVEDQCLVGRQGANGEAGDLFSDEKWADFELECEWRMRFPGNSGLWFRVDRARTGYQADFLDQASHPGVLSGSLYCMGKAFIAENRDATSVIKDGWNALRVRAAGPSITIQQNGKQIIQVSDSTFLKPGSIGLQVHAGKDFTGMEVRLRNLRIRSL